MKDSHFEISKQRLVCENIRFSVFFETVMKDGEIAVEDYMTISPKACNGDQIAGVITLPVDNGKYGLLKIFRPPIRAYSWELPGGFVEINETPALSAIRELKEEAGITCEEKYLVHLGTFYPAPGLISCKLAIFSAENCKPAPQAQVPELGISQFEWFSEAKVEELIEKGIICDLPTIFAIQRRMKLLNK